jgi:hypothetical protein
MNKMDLEKMDNMINSINNNTNNSKRIKKETGLIERVEINKVVLTEDNKMLLKD